MSFYRQARTRESLVLFRFPACLESLTFLWSAVFIGALAYGAYWGWLRDKGWGWLAAAVPLALFALFTLGGSILRMWTHEQLVVDTGAGRLIFTSRTPLGLSTDFVRFDEIDAVRLGGTVHEPNDGDERSGTCTVELVLERRAIPLGNGDERSARVLASRLSALLDVSVRDEVEVRPHEPDFD